jgi:undecaprenyl diphosphate synthase
MVKKQIEGEINSIPSHIAIVMDGNRRWAKKRGLPSALGHKEGYNVFVRMMEIFFKRGVKTMTVYAFSTENWQRDAAEISAIMDLLRYAVSIGGKRIIKENLRFRLIGRKQDLPKDILSSIEKLEEETKENIRGDVNIAFSYGGRSEITNAVNMFLAKNEKARVITEADIANNLYTAGQKNPELIIRTGGKCRLSNFLTWQSVYSELYFADVLWPDFNEKELDKALDFYVNTQRNFGK